MYFRTFPFDIHSDTMESGAGDLETPKNATIFGCEIHLHIATSLQNTFGDSQRRMLMGYRERWMSHLCNLLYVIVPVNPECLYRNFLVIVNALPNIAETARGNSDLARLDKCSRYNVGMGEQSHTTTELAKLLEYLHIVFGGRESLHHVVMLRVVGRDSTRFLGTPYQIPPTTPSPFPRPQPGRRSSVRIARGP